MRHWYVEDDLLPVRVGDLNSGRNEDTQSIRSLIATRGDLSNWLPVDDDNGYRAYRSSQRVIYHIERIMIPDSTPQNSEG